MKKMILSLSVLLLTASLSFAQLQVNITGTLSFCQGHSTLLTAVASGGNAPYSYLWSDASVLPDVIAYSAGLYSVTVTDQLGDTASAQVVVTEFPAPTLAVAGNPFTTCQGSCITMAASGSGISYTWSPSSGLSCINCIAPVACPFTTTTYTVVAMDGNGCTASTAVTITILPPTAISVDTNFVTLCQGDTVTLNAYGALTYQWNTGQVGGSISVSPSTTTTYTVTGTDFMGCMGMASIFVSVVPCSNLIPKAGIVYDDLNGNGIRDIGEPPISGAIITEDPYPYFFMTNDSGEYQAYYDSGAPTLTIYNSYPYCTPSPTVHTLTGTNDTLNDFGVHCVPFSDVAVVIGSSSAVPGFGMNYWITIYNFGNQVMNGTVSFTYDNLLTFLSAPDPPVVFPDSLVWTYTNLSPGTSHTFWTGFSLPGSVIPGVSLLSQATVTPAQDSLPANNHFDHWMMVTGSFDPNDKKVSDSVIALNDIGSEPYLYYTIHFQNVGNDTAVNIVVRDTLDASTLLVPSIYTLGASHPCTFSLDPDGVAVWTFDHIMLPDSNVDQEGSNGMVMFMIRAQGSLGLGSSIENSAAIYFDFNTPVITNTTYTLVDDVLGNPEEQIPGTASMKLFPNPAQGSLNILVSLPEGGALQLKLFDVSGQMVYSTTKPAPNGVSLETIDLSGLSEGVYVVQMISGTTVDIQRVVIFK